jgi:hypothetical protein
MGRGMKGLDDYLTREEPGDCCGRALEELGAPVPPGEAPDGPTVRLCEGCGKPLGFIESQRWPVCLPCTRARQRAATTGGRCRCPRSQRREVTVNNQYRRWVACARCLGVVRQLT